MRKLLYTIFISNNHAPCHFLLERDLVKCQKTSKYYDHDCWRRKNFNVKNLYLLFVLLFNTEIFSEWLKSNTEFFKTKFQNVISLRNYSVNLMELDHFPDTLLCMINLIFRESYSGKTEDVLLKG